MKKPTFQWTRATATIMFTEMARAAILVKNPATKATAPTDSAKMARRAKIVGMWKLDSNHLMEAVKPPPPNQTRSFWAPWGQITTPSKTLRTVPERPLSVAKSLLNMLSPLLFFLDPVELGPRGIDGLSDLGVVRVKAQA